MKFVATMMSGGKAGSGGGRRNNPNRGRPSPSGSATFGEGRMHRSNSGSRFNERPQHGTSSFPSTPLAVDIRSTFNSKEITELLHSKVQAAMDRHRAWLELSEAEKRSRKRKSLPTLYNLF